MSQVDPLAVFVFLVLVGAVLAISFYMGSRARDAQDISRLTVKYTGS